MGLNKGDARYFSISKIRMVPTWCKKLLWDQAYQTQLPKVNIAKLGRKVRPGKNDG